MDRGDPPGVTRLPIALTIAGSDSGAGAGVQADLRTFAALGVYGASVVTALTAQNTRGVRAVHPAPPEIVVAQIAAVMDDFAVAAIKIGMLANAEIASAVAAALPSPACGRGAGGEGEGAGPLHRPADAPPPPFHGGGTNPAPSGDPPPHSGGGADPAPSGDPPPHRGGGGPRVSAVVGARPILVYDPVLAASSGDVLSGAGFVEAIRAKLLPIVDCLTPNLAEAARLLDAPVAASEAEMARQGDALLALGPRAVLMKGGHLDGDAVDLVVTADGVRRFPAPRIASRNLHGTGCTLSSAIAAHLVLGLPLAEAVGAAKTFVREAIERGRGVTLGGGAGPLIQTPLHD